jgi:hypothetical protein
VQEALLTPDARNAAAGTLQLGVVLFNWLSSLATRDRQPIIAFRAYDHQRPAAASIENTFVGLAPREDVEQVCPRLSEVQVRANDAFEAVKSRGAIDQSAAAFGTAVHMRLKHDIDALQDANFRAEVSALKSDKVEYGAKDSVRIDVFENVDDRTVCVYDIKTGRSGLSMRRAEEIAAKVFDSYPRTQRILLIEVRTKR